MVNGYSLVDGTFRNNAAIFFPSMKPFEERTDPSQLTFSVLPRLNRQFAQLKEGFVFALNPPSIPGLGTTGGFEFYIQNRGAGDTRATSQAVQAYLAAARQRPELAGLTTTFRGATQQLFVDLDRNKAEVLGVPVQDAFQTMQTFFGSSIAGQFSQFSRVWWVVLQADASYRINPDDFDKVFVRSKTGNMVPLAGLITVRYVAAPKLMERFNGFPAVKITGSPAPGFSSGQALAAMEAVARETLPGDFSYAWAGQALQEKQAGGTSAIAFVGGLIVVFLLLAAQFEKWTLPIAVVLTVPIAILGALLLTWVRGLENDVYFQVGLVTLVGLSAKNAILICEFAIERVRHGMAVKEAAIEAAGLRLRAIVMTSLAFGLGCVPLAIASGPGREQPACDRHRRDRRDPRLDHRRGVLRAALLLDAREHERALRREESGRRRARPAARRPRPHRTRSGRTTDVRKFALAAVITALVAGCTVGPDYSRPQTTSPDHWRIDYPAAADVANTRWWEQFGDPALNQLIDTALRENRDLLIAAARVDQFVGQLAVVRSQFYPQIGYSADVSRNRASRLGNPADPVSGRSLLHAVPGRAERAVADRSLRARAPPERGRAGAGVRERAGPPRRHPDDRDQRRHQLHHAARARPATRDRAGDGEELRRDRAHLRAALQGRGGLGSGAQPGRVAVPAGARRRARARAGDRRAGEPDLDPARAQSRPDPARPGDRRVRRTRDSCRPPFDPARAPARHPAGRADAGRRRTRTSAPRRHCTSRLSRSPGCSAR